jgi:membrane-associated phospholipid phosphatase
VEKREESIMIFLIFILSLSVAGCGTLPNGRGWGQDALSSSSLARIPRAAYNALFDLHTLLPAVGAVVCAAGDFDDDVADWATRHTPVFGSVEDAQKASDWLRATLQVEAAVTALATPSGNASRQWAYWKAKGLGVELAALGVTGGVTQLLKATTDRGRPDEPQDKTSFPSGHASGAFAAATLANRNVDALAVSQPLRRTVQIANLGLASGTAWARLEGGRHFPSDVLAGAALGHFLSAFIHDAFLGLPDTGRFRLIILPAAESTRVELSFGF